MKIFSDYSIIMYAQYFGAGILCYFIWKKISWSPIPHRAFFTIALLAIAALMIFAGEIQYFYGRNIGWDNSKSAMTATWAVAMMLLVLGMSFERFHSRTLVWTAKLGEASFSLYLWHPFIIGCLILSDAYRTIYRHISSIPLAFGVSVAATLVILLPVSLLSYAWIERRTGIAIRRRLFESAATHKPVGASAN